MGFNIIAGVCIVIVIAAGVFEWWMENGPEKKEDKKEHNGHMEDRK